MYDARRGVEGLDELKIGNFKLVADPNRKIRYWLKVSKKGF